MKKVLFVILLCAITSSSYSDWDFDHRSGEVRIEASFTDQQIKEILEVSLQLEDASLETSAIAFLLAKKFSCSEYKFDPKAESISGVLLEIGKSVTDLKTISFKRKQQNQIEMIIDLLLPFTKAEVSLCNKENQIHRCEAKKSEYVSFLRTAKAKGTQLLLIERTLSERKELENYPFSKSDASRRLKSLIVCAKEV